MRSVLLGSIILLGITAVPAHALYTCSISADPMGFGLYDPLDGTPLDSQSEIRVRCHLLGLVGLLVSYEISLDTGVAGSFDPRSMAGPVDSLEYNLYLNSPRTQIWGDGTGGTSTRTDSYFLGIDIGGITLHYPVYGRIFPLQNVGAGTYSDTIIATVDF